jgi:SAM-dependent methyltransferase
MTASRYKLETARKADKMSRILERTPLRVDAGVWWFIPALDRAKARTFFEALQERFKRGGSLYPRLVSWFSPVLPSRAFNRCRAGVLSRHGLDSVIMNLGSGPGRLPGRSDIINVDCFDHHGVDLVADTSSLPVADGSVDLVLSVAVLEHVDNPAAQIAEMVRVLRPGGELFCFMPFLQPFHAAPHDFTRLTSAGLRNWFPNLEVVEEGMGAGPTSALLWIAQQWLAMILSLGSEKAYGVLLALIMLATWPVKHLDRLLEGHPRAGDGASGFYILARKA